jgi:hypothetical protein
VRLLTLFLISLVAAPAFAATAALELVSDSPELAGLQVQRPVWAPGTNPRLVHEATDRSRRSLLRVVTFNSDPVIIPATRSSRLAALGAGAERADGAAEWWDAEGFFFVRSSVSSVTAHYWDGVLRDLPGTSGRPTAITRDPAGGLLVAMEDASGLDLFRFPGTDLAAEPRRLTVTQDDVEHSVTALPDGRVVFISASREATRLVLLGERGPATVPLRIQAELLSLSALPDNRILAWARQGEKAHHALLLIDLTRGDVSVLATDGFLPPGVAPRPAVSSESGWIYYVRADPDQGNPVVRLRTDGSPPQALSLSTTGHQEVAVHSYPGKWGGAADWLAVVAVGDPAGDDVVNHLFIGQVSDAGAAP